MNVGFVTPQICLNSGGIQNTSYLFVEAFSELCDFHAFCSKDSEIVKGFEQNIDCSAYEQKQTFRLHGDLIRKVFSEHKRQKFDFTFAILYSYALSSFFLKKMKGVPYGVMIHGNELMKEPSRNNVRGKFIRWFKGRFKDIIFKNADIIFANSNYTKELIINLYGKKNVVVIHPPIKFVDRHEDLSANEPNYVLLSIGRVVERKGFQYVLDAISELKREYPSIRYYIAGNGSYEEVLREKVNSLGLGENVFLLGRISEEEKDSLYRKCDYFIMPSYMIEDCAEVEGYGIVYIEANMYGKYVIATKSGGISDAVSEGVTGSFVETEDSGSIQECILGLYHSDFKYDSQKCVEWAKKNDSSVIAQEYVNQFNRIIQS